MLMPTGESLAGPVILATAFQVDSTQPTPAIGAAVASPHIQLALFLHFD